MFRVVCGEMVLTDKQYLHNEAVFGTVRSGSLQIVIDERTETLHEGTVKDVSGFRPKPVPNGNYQVEVCASEDGEYLAVMLYKFIQLGYEPVTGMHSFEGEKAHILKQILF